MSRAHVTEELIKAVKNHHKRHPAMTQKELAERIGCLAATVGRILAGKYDKNVDTDNDEGAKILAKSMENQQKTSMDNISNFILTDMVRDENGKICFVPRDENQQKTSGETVFKIDTSNVAMAEVLKTVIDILAGASKPSMPAAPIPEERFKYEVLTELKAIKEIEADTYKELKQLKGILADIRDMLK